MGGGLSFEELRNGTIEIENSNNHFSLHNDLIEHLWQKKRRDTLLSTVLHCIHFNLLKFYYATASLRTLVVPLIALLLLHYW